MFITIEIDSEVAIGKSPECLAQQVQMVLDAAGERLGKQIAGGVKHGGFPVVHPACTAPFGTVRLFESKSEFSDEIMADAQEAVHEFNREEL